jgi:hypothetical protein
MIGIQNNPLIGQDRNKSVKCQEKFERKLKEKGSREDQEIDRQERWGLRVSLTQWYGIAEPSHGIGA